MALLIFNHKNPMNSLMSFPQGKMKHNIYSSINVSLKQASFLRKKIFGPLHFRVAFEKNMCEDKCFIQILLHAQKFVSYTNMGLSF